MSGLPYEYCEFSKETYEKCKKADPAKHGLSVEEDNSAEAAAGAGVAAGEAPKAEGAPEEEKKSSGGGGGSGGKKKKNEGVVVLNVSQRNKRKFVTTVQGLEFYDIKLPEVSKKFAKRFSCGASVGKNASNQAVIDIQGDVSNELFEILTEEYEIPEDRIVIQEEKKKGKK